jgi:hypothetical protein
MSAIVLRAEKGDLLTHEEMDNNFTQVDVQSRTFTKTFTIGADLVPTVGVAPFVPGKDCRITSFFLTLGKVSTAIVSIDMKVNGVTIFPNSKPSIALGTLKSDPVVINYDLVAGDRVTVDVLTTGGQYLSAILTVVEKAA